MDDKKEVRYFRDKDHPDVIVRVWYDGGKRRGQLWGAKKKEWIDADKAAWEVADEIYENHPLTEDEVKELVGK